MAAGVNPRDLCLRLMHADSETEVVAILGDAGYWDDPDVWRYLDDNENNFSSIGNQQSEPIAALVEKIVNGVDARLTNACHEAGIDPESSEAPSSIREAVARFFEGRDDPRADLHGRIADWTAQKATTEGRLLTLAATGNKPAEGRPCLTIADYGEGQTPDSFPHTFMSLGESNKLRIHFVQGKFNMGGTGALNFCSEHHRLQLVVSRRNPLLVARGSARDQEWGFTVVRRQRGSDGARSSVYTYLAPIRGTGSDAGSVLSFPADAFPILPEDPTGKNRGADAYARDASHGSLVKLYEYDWQGVKSNIVSSGEGLLRRVDLALPELALPVRLFECRPYGGGPASYSTNALGLVARLEQNKAENLEDDFPVGASISLDGRRIAVRAYAFRPDKARQYRQHRYGVVFGVNGQMHGAFTADFFSRKSVKLGYIADSLLVVVDCSSIDELMREDLFMNSRDRLRDTPLARRLEEELERYLKNEPALRTLQNERRAARNADRLRDDKPLADVLQTVLNSNPLLSRLFQHGLRLSAPFPPNTGAGPGSASDFKGVRYPTFFRFKGLASGEELKREAQLGSRIRVSLETDAVDDYFVRDASPGALRVQLRVGDEWQDAPDWSSTGPRTGLAQLWINSLPDGAGAGDIFEYRVEVTDDSRVDAFESRMFLTAVPAHGGGPGGGGKGRAGNKGKGKSGGSSELALPPITPVHEVDWEANGMDEQSALKIVISGDGDDDVTAAYDFFVNVDNRYLRIAQKESRADSTLLEKQFLYGMVLVGLALLHGRRNNAPGSDAIGVPRPDDSPEEFVASATSALAPIFLPMLESIGGLSADDEA